MADDTIPFVKKYLNQDAVYWGVEDFDENGKAIYQSPIEIKCRWEDKSEQFVDKEGHDQVSNSVVIVDRDLDDQGVLWLGLLQDVEDQFVPVNNERAYEIKKKEKIPNKKTDKFFRRVFL